MAEIFTIRKITVATIVLALFFLVSAAFAADYRPVMLNNDLIGAFDGDKWIYGPGEVNVDGKVVNLHNVEENEEFFTKLTEAEEAGGMPCEISVLKVGQRFVYYSPEGREAMATVTGTNLYYEGEYSGGAALSVVFDDIELDYEKLNIGVLEGINAVPVPTVRENENKRLVFSCEYKGKKYSVEWRQWEGDGFKGKLSVGKRSWDIEDESEDKPLLNSYADVNEVFCGFYDLNGDGSLELVVYDSGPNGCVSFFKIDPEAGPKMFAWVYTGNE